MPLDAAQLELLRTQGYLALPGFFPPRHVAALRERLEELRAAWETQAARRIGVRQEPGVLRDGTESAATVHSFTDLAREDAGFYRHARNSALLEVVEQILGMPLSLYTDHAFLKPPHHGSEMPPHQDNAALGIYPPDCGLTCWTALDDADPDNGCLHYHPGSHLAGLLPHRDAPGTDLPVLEQFSGAGAVAVPIAAGGLILHHPLTVHWSPPNTTDRWRRAFTCHFVRSDAEMRLRRPNSPPLVEVRA